MDKKISFFWGNDTMSWLRYMSLWTFRKLNPDWDMRLFVCGQRRTKKYWKTPEQQDFFTYTGPDYTDRLDDIAGLQVIPWEVEKVSLQNLGPSHKSNFFKWGLLAKESGVYADLDIVFIRSANNWLRHVGGHDVAICYRQPPRNYFSIGLLGSSGRGQFYNDVYQESMRGFGPGTYQSAGVEAIYRLTRKLPGPDHWRKLVRRYSRAKFIDFDKHFVYPWGCSQIPEMTVKLHTTVPAKTFGIHWYAGHPTAQQLNSVLNEDTVKTNQSTVAHFLRSVL